MFKQHHMDWRMGHSPSKTVKPLKFIPASVPGAVQLDWAGAEGWPSPDYDNDTGRYAWMEDEYWLYKGRISFAKPEKEERLFFCCKGIDYRFEIRLAGRLLLEQEGMFTPVDLDLTDIAVPGSEIEILIHPAPKSHSLPVDHHQANQSCKPAVSYGWDFHPRLIPLGIWDDVRLETRPAFHIKDVKIDQRLNGDCSAAELEVEIGFSRPAEFQVLWELFDPSGRSILRRELPGKEPRLVFNTTIDKPDLWWPNGSGAQPLYRNEISVLDGRRNKIQTVVRKTGFRKIRLTMGPEGWNDPDVDRMPKGPNKSPVTLEVNGRLVFGKGSNWVSPDIFPGRLSADHYEGLLNLAKDGHFNMLRCWGGAAIQKDGFFDRCDELGVMVWQEFPLSCSRYEGEPAYLKVLDAESRSIIKRLRHHACLVLWCGGNELFNSWSRMTEQDKALRLLNSNCFTLDPDRSFLTTSPLYGVGHGDYVFRTDGGVDVFRSFQSARCTAYTEFGVPAPAAREEIEHVIPGVELFPPSEKSPSWRKRHGFRAWEGSPESWLELSCIRHYFGEPKDLDELVRNGQTLQAEGLKSIFEEARRQKPVCSMALNWCFNEPWPSAASSSIVQWNGKPKPGYFGTQAALRPVLASARIRKFDWSEGEIFDPEIWILNDTFREYPEGRVEADVYLDDSFHSKKSWNFPVVRTNTNVKGPVVRFDLPDRAWTRIVLKLSIADRTGWNSEYVLLRSRRTGS